MSEQQVITAKIMLDASDSLALRNLRRYVVMAVKQSCRDVRGGTVVVRLEDEHGGFLGLDMAGTLSEETKEIVSDLFGDPELGSEGMSSSA